VVQLLERIVSFREEPNLSIVSCREGAKLGSRAILFACSVALAILGFIRIASARADDAKTLRETLAAEGISVEGKSLANIDKRITSGATLKNADEFLIAYYLDDGSGLLNPPLYLHRLDRKTNIWTSATLGEIGSSADTPDSVCYGAVLDIGSFLDRYILETHINPSAGCVLIVSHELKFRTVLYGWVLGHFDDGTIIFHRNQIHFATVHPAEIAVYQEKNRKDFTFFPPKAETPVREVLTAELRDFYHTHQDYCAKANDPCDPMEFDSSLTGQIAVDEHSHAAAFSISYELQGYGQDEKKPSGPNAVVYVYRNLDDVNKIECRELLSADVKARFGDISLQKLVEPAQLEMIFENAASPQTQSKKLSRPKVTARLARSTHRSTDRR
jgi:hypothetical protein